MFEGFRFANADKGIAQDSIDQIEGTKRDLAVRRDPEA